MLTTRLVKPKGSGVWHVIDEGETARLADELHVLCGHRFDRRGVIQRNQVATCRECAKRDNPFELSQDQEILFWKIAAKKGDWRLRHDMTLRDLFRFQVVQDPAISPMDPELAPKGLILKRDFETTVPWADAEGVMHKRRAMFRGKAICGAKLYGLDQMTYSRLERMMNMNENARVTCIDCLADHRG